MANMLAGARPTTRDANQPEVKPDERDGGAIRQIASHVRRTANWLGELGSFWTVVPLVGIIGFIYLYGFTDDLYQSQAVVDLQNSSSGGTSISSLGASLLGSTGSATQSGAVVQYIQSPDILKVLDKQFHLRQLYASKDHSLFWRLDPDASDEDFLSFYQQMVTVTQDSTTLLITINALDYDAKRAQALCNTIVALSQKFVIDMSAQMQAATLKYAKAQLVQATKDVETAQPYQRATAEMELTAAQQALVAAEGLANQQQAFLIPVQAPNFPTDTGDPDRLVDEATILLASAALYLIAHLLLANLRDNSKA